MSNVGPNENPEFVRLIPDENERARFYMFEDLVKLQINAAVQTVFQELIAEPDTRAYLLALRPLSPVMQHYVNLGVTQGLYQEGDDPNNLAVGVEEEEEEKG